MNALLFRFRRTAFDSQLKSTTHSLNLRSATSSPRPQPLRINLNLDGAPIASRAHTHLSHSQTSRLLSIFLSLDTPLPPLHLVCARLRHPPALALTTPTPSPLSHNTDTFAPSFRFIRYNKQLHSTIGCTNIVEFDP
jgi:hypothetical protein